MNNMNNMKPYMLANIFHIGMLPPRSDPNCKPPRKWLGSEKFDGYRAQYFPDEDTFLSRALKPFKAFWSYSLEKPFLAYFGVIQ